MSLFISKFIKIPEFIELPEIIKKKSGYILISDEKDFREKILSRYNEFFLNNNFEIHTATQSYNDNLRKIQDFKGAFGASNYNKVKKISQKMALKGVVYYYDISNYFDIFNENLFRFGPVFLGGFRFFMNNDKIIIFIDFIDNYFEGVLFINFKEDDILFDKNDSEIFVPIKNIEEIYEVYSGNIPGIEIYLDYLNVSKEDIIFLKNKENEEVKSICEVLGV